MMYTTTATRNELVGIFDINSLPESSFKLAITPISKEETDRLGFRA